MTLPSTTCGHDGGRGIGAGHACACTRPIGHALDSERPHGCPCGAMWPDSNEREDGEIVSGLSDAVLNISRMIDSTYPPDLDREAWLWRRCVKVAEESGEVTAAVLGMLAANQRKGRTHEAADVRKELLDVALAALAAVAHVTGNVADPVRLLKEHAQYVHDRLAAARNENTTTEGEPA